MLVIWHDDQVYSGGIGSYALLVMVAAFLMLHPSRQEGGQGESSTGVLLLDFFRLFGRVLNMNAVGISCRWSRPLTRPLFASWVANTRPNDWTATCEQVLDLEVAGQQALLCLLHAGCCQPSLLSGVTHLCARAVTHLMAACLQELFSGAMSL